MLSNNCGRMTGSRSSISLDISLISVGGSFETHSNPFGLLSMCQMIRDKGGWVEHEREIDLYGTPGMTARTAKRRSCPKFNVSSNAQPHAQTNSRQQLRRPVTRKLITALPRIHSSMLRARSIFPTGEWSPLYTIRRYAWVSQPQTRIEKIVQKYAVDGAASRVRAGDYVMIRPDHV